MSRDAILASLRANKTVSTAGLPAIPDFEEPGWNLVDHFERALEASKTAVHRVSATEDLNQFIQNKFPDAKVVWSDTPEVSSTVEKESFNSPAALATLEVVVLGGELGVADTGAIWISDQTLRLRILPFITQQLVIIVESRLLVPEMHQAYRTIQPNGLTFGVFISGPSKTADIEQAMVVGAHGPLGLTVIIRD